MGPLTGLRVLDFSSLLPGPFATRMLADMGAEVLRVESPRHPDLLNKKAAAFAHLNREKKRKVLDLASPEAISEVRALLTEYDVILEQFRPGVMARFGLDYDSLKGDFPRLIYCSLTGYGQTGPRRDQAGHDINYQALTGLASYGGGPRPELTSVPLADLAGGSMQAVIAIQAAVIERLQTGFGQYLDVSMTDGALALNALTAPEVLAGGKSPESGSEWLNGGLFYDYYRCQDDLWLAVGGLEPKFIVALCQGLERPDWLPRFADLSPPGQTALKADLQALFETRPRSVWLSKLAADNCVEPVSTLAEALDDPHFRARGMVVDQDGERRLGSAMRFPGSRL